jgi:hypothetical protein
MMRKTKCQNISAAWIGEFSSHFSAGEIDRCVKLPSSWKV